MKITYLGPKGTFSEKAAISAAGKIKESAELMPEWSLEAVARSVAEGKSEFGVMAYYNYLEGLVQECLDLIYENNLKIVRAERVHPVFAIGMHRKNIGNSSIYSHPKALAQCSDYLQHNYPEAQQIRATSTAAAVAMARDRAYGLAIADREAFDEEMVVLDEDIGNKKHGRKNFTDFYVVSREYSMETPEHALTMVAITPHIDRPRLLRDILDKIDMNMKKIHSRPAIDHVDLSNGNEPQMFYLEIASHMESEKFKKCVSGLEMEFGTSGKELVRILGSYSKQG